MGAGYRRRELRAASWLRVRHVRIGDGGIGTRKHIRQTLRGAPIKNIKARIEAGAKISAMVSSSFEFMCQTHKNDQYNHCHFW